MTTPQTYWNVYTSRDGDEVIEHTAIHDRWTAIEDIRDCPLDYARTLWEHDGIVEAIDLTDEAAAQIEYEREEAEDRLRLIAGHGARVVA